ncbi:hypothetical protein ONV78_07415 [Hahella sp. CR1]|uniref:hypothetical protein n=1 Tax=Hahella sp. CR1 TaxID=2992807 RepID=UPI002442CB28|nr:hypothetical protein [Hahella sp. CR1]MDG9667554.1 hypothetical protein [Hahella sp. CR1]
MAEGKYEYKTDVNLIFGNQKVGRTHVLRTTLNSLPVWKIRNPEVSLSPFRDRTIGITKDASVIDGEMWVFGINATLSQDIVAAVKVAANYFDITPSKILMDIYAKNLNVDGEHEMGNKALIDANKVLYKNICKALSEAAKWLGVSNNINFYVFSKNNNNKIPQPDLHEALKSGGATSVTTDTHMPKVKIGSNDGEKFIPQLSNFHLATLKI